MLQKPIYIDDWSFWVTLTDEEVKIGQKMGGNRGKYLKLGYFGPHTVKIKPFWAILGPI